MPVYSVAFPPLPPCEPRGVSRSRREIKMRTEYRSFSLFLKILFWDRKNCCKWLRETCLNALSLSGQRKYIQHFTRISSIELVVALRAVAHFVTDDITTA